MWPYYLNQLCTSSRTILCGFGVNSYLPEHGGYGLVAHNSFISGLMGFGIIGTALVIFSYAALIFSERPSSKTTASQKIMALSVLLSVVLGYFFLDGLMDVRLSMYLSLFVMVYCFGLNDFNCVTSVKTR